MDAQTVIIAAHAEVERAFAEFDRAEGSRTAQYRAVVKISNALAAHNALEQDELWPALRDQTGSLDGDIERQLELGHVMEVLLIELGTMIPSDPRYAAKVGLLLDLFRRHARDTELAMVPELRRRLGDAEGRWLGARLAERERQLVTGPAA
jgi:hypothetical protein